MGYFFKILVKITQEFSLSTPNVAIFLNIKFQIALHCLLDFLSAGFIFILLKGKKIKKINCFRLKNLNFSGNEKKLIEILYNFYFIFWKPLWSIYSQIFTHVNPKLFYRTPKFAIT